LPAHPAGAPNLGSGGTAPKLMPAVCTHEVGCAASNTTLCALPPVGYENVTVPPAAMLTVVSDWSVPDPS
jgi:hypothetical protein